MTKENPVSFAMLDVGCGTKPKGDVNVDFFQGGLNPQTGDQIQGLLMSPKRIKNFVVADAMHLPFKDESFNVVFSSHTIEHVPNPFLMLREMCRVAKKKIIVRCPHRRGTGAVMPYHLNFFDEEWFKKAAGIVGSKGIQFITFYEAAISSRFRKICPLKYQKNLFWSALEHFERLRFMERFRTPSEIEVWLRKKRSFTDTVECKFLVVYNNYETLKTCFLSSPYVPRDDIIQYFNKNNEPLSKVFNEMIQKHMQENAWFVLCHQDFVLGEDLRPRLMGKEIEAVYGPIGVSLSENKPLGRIIQTDGTSIGRQLKADAPVQILDEMCLIAHSEVFRQGLSFNESFGFHFYGADLCMRAYTLGFDVLAMQLRCQHKSKNLYGAITSAEYLSALKMFGEKWRQFLPVRTTTKLIT